MSEHPIVLDLDDFTGSPKDVARLTALKTKIPDFKVTLFTIPGIISQLAVERIRGFYPWVDLAPHGFMHHHSRECQDWTQMEMRQCLYTFAGWPFTRGFKAPGWQLSDACYEVLHEAGYWLADQQYNRHRRPEGMGIYELDRPEKIHGHLGHMGGHNANELEYLIPQLLELKDREFGFVRDFVKPWHTNSIS